MGGGGSLPSGLFWAAGSLTVVAALRSVPPANAATCDLYGPTRLHSERRVGGITFVIPPSFLFENIATAKVFGFCGENRESYLAADLPQLNLQICTQADTQRLTKRIAIYKG